MVDADITKEEDFEGAIEKSNTITLESIELKSVMALYGFLTTTAKWTKLQQDYALISNQMATKASSRFYAFRMA